MAEELEAFAPVGLIDEAEQSGFFHCKRCGLVWFGTPSPCPEGSHGHPVRVALLCRTCDVAVPLEELADHLAGVDHAM